MAPTLDARKESVGEVPQRVARGLDPAAGTSANDSRARLIERGRLHAMVEYVRGSTRPGLPNFEAPRPGAPGVIFMHLELAIVAEKMVRVLLHCKRRRYVERHETVMAATDLPDATVQRVLSGIQPKAIWLNLEHGPGTRSTAADFEYKTTLWCFRFWDRLNLLACCGPTEHVRTICSGWEETGGRRGVQLVLPDSAYAAVGAVPPSPRARRSNAPDGES